MDIKRFSKYPLRGLLDRNTEDLLSTIDGLEDDYILNVEEDKYLAYINDNFTIEDVQIKFENASVTHEERNIPAELLPYGFFVRKGESYKKGVIKYHIPIEGNIDLLAYEPSARILWVEDINIEDNEITFEIIDFHDDPEQLNSKYSQLVNNIKEQCSNLIKEVSEYNNGLLDIAKKALESRKSKILKKNDFLASLIVPIRKKKHTPNTFTVPSVRKKVRPQYNKPEVMKKGFKPEPTIDESIYKDILKLINDIGKEFERLPSTYADKDEETLRDHIVLMLEPNFEGTTTGETFNKTGKTDILIRHEGSNLFVAECKFWTGEKAYLDTIEQLLGYLTWRDSKTAIILFVRNKDFSSVIKKIKDVTPTHENFIGHIKDEDETWTNWLFHIPGDKDREVKIAVMEYHIPPVAK
jgi:hypothetical protein